MLRDKFRWTEDAVKLAGDRIGDFTEKVEPSRKVDAVKDDPTDNKILECGTAARSVFIVTGDKHLLSVGSFGGAEIVKVADFLNRQAREQRR